MRTAVRITIAAAAATAIGAGLTGAVAVAGSPRVTGAQTIRLHEKDITDTVQDQAAKGFGPGDEIFTYGRLTNSHGRDVGRMGSECVLVSTKAVGDAFCVLNARLPHGGITFQGLVSFKTTTFDVAITGGTGNYQNARGHVVITGTNKPSSVFTFYLLP